MHPKKLFFILSLLTIIANYSFGQDSICFHNDGLRYRTVVKITSSIVKGTTKIKGIVFSDEYDDNIKEQASFTGKQVGNKYIIKFKEKAPVVGDASNWTNEPWILKEANGKSILLITFYAKDYESNQWSNIACEFTLCN